MGDPGVERLRRCWELGLPVPDPVEIDETEILMERITHSVDGEVETAPRVAQVRPGPDVVRGFYDQLRETLLTLVQAGLVHGDLSPYNTLAAGDRLVIIDLPQMVDLVGNPRGRTSCSRCATCAPGSARGASRSTSRSCRRADGARLLSRAAPTEARGRPWARPDRVVPRLRHEAAPGSYRDVSRARSTEARGRPVARPDRVIPRLRHEPRQDRIEM